MNQWDDTWTLAHDLALLFVALAYGTDRRLSDEEMSTITHALQQWKPAASDETIRAILVEATTVLMEDNASDEVRQVVRRLGEELSEDELNRVLQQVTRIAEADGILLQREEHLIGTLAEAWSLRGLERPADDGAVESRDLLRQMALIYVVVAHSTDDELSSDEIEVILKRLRGWDEVLDGETVRDVLRDALTTYAQEPDEEVLGKTIMTIKKSLPPMRRLILLDDLYHIAYADGTFTENERDMITSLAAAWGMSVRLNGSAPA